MTNILLGPPATKACGLSEDVAIGDPAVHVVPLVDDKLFVLVAVLSTTMVVVPLSAIYCQDLPAVESRRVQVTPSGDVSMSPVVEVYPERINKLYLDTHIELIYEYEPVITLAAKGPSVEYLLPRIACKAV